MLDIFFQNDPVKKDESVHFPIKLFAKNLIFILQIDIWTASLWAEEC